MTIEERLTRIEQKIDTLLKAGITDIMIHAGPAPTEVRLKPFNKKLYTDAILAAHQNGNYKQLQEYLKEYEGPKPHKI